MTFKGQIKVREFFNGLYLLNGACYDKSLYETHIVSHYGILVDLMTFIGQIKYNCAFNRLYLLNGDQVYMKHI